MLCIGPPPNLAANCRLSVAARSRPQCRAGVHARRSSLASPHRKPPPAQIYNMPPPHLTPLSRHTRFRRPLPAANLQSLPCKGRCRRRRRRGAAPRPANTLPGRSIPPSSHTLYRPPTLCHLPPLPRRKTKTAARLFAGPRSPRVFFHCLRRRARMVCRGLPRYASPPSSRRINGTTSLGWMSSTSANSVYSIFSASRIAASSKPESRLPTACRFFLKS